MKNKSEEIKELFENLSNNELKNLVNEYKILTSTGQLPEVSNFRDIGTRISTTFETDYNIGITLAFLTDEVSNRFTNA